MSLQGTASSDRCYHMPSVILSSDTERKKREKIMKGEMTLYIKESEIILGVHKYQDNHCIVACHYREGCLKNWGRKTSRLLFMINSAGERILVQNFALIGLDGAELAEEGTEIAFYSHVTVSFIHLWRLASPPLLNLALPGHGTSP